MQKLLIGLVAALSFGGECPGPSPYDGGYALLDAAARDAGWRLVLEGWDATSALPVVVDPGVRVRVFGPAGETDAAVGPGELLVVSGSAGDRERWPIGVMVDSHRALVVASEDAAQELAEALGAELDAAGDGRWTLWAEDLLVLSALVEVPAELVELTPLPLGREVVTADESPSEPPPPPPAPRVAPPSAAPAVGSGRAPVASRAPIPPGGAPPPAPVAKPPGPHPLRSSGRRSTARHRHRVSIRAAVAPLRTVQRRVTRPDVGMPTRGPDTFPSGPPSLQALACGPGSGALIRLPEEIAAAATLTVELWVRSDRSPLDETADQTILQATGGDGYRSLDLDLSWRSEHGRRVGRDWMGLGHTLSHWVVPDEVSGPPRRRGRGISVMDPLSRGRWYHYAVVVTNDADGALRSREYLNGRTVMRSGTVDPEPLNWSARDLWLCRRAAGGGEPFVGAIDDLRISRTARYDRYFIPPASPTRDDDTLLLLTFEDDDLAGLHLELTDQVRTPDRLEVIAHARRTERSQWINSLFRDPAVAAARMRELLAEDRRADL